MMECDIAVVGGGHTGLLLATSLADTGFDLRVIEPEAPESPPGPRDGRNLALLRGSAEIAMRLGVWPAIAAVAEPVWHVRLEDRPGGVRLAWAAADHGGEPFAWGVEHGRLRGALFGVFRERFGDNMLLPDRVVGLERTAHRITLRLLSGRSLSARLVVGADGRGSQIRVLAGIGLDRWAYGQAALAFVVAPKSAHANTIHEWLRPAGPLALLPLPDRLLGVTWVEAEGEARRLAAMPEAPLLERLARETEGRTAGCELASRIGVWPLSAQHARRYVAPRLALVGDAAHGVHPIHAQGFNMAVADVAVLHDLLREAHRRGGDPGSAQLLLAYERARRTANLKRIWMTDGLVRIFSNALPPLVAARGAALRLVGMVPPLARFAVVHGTHLI
jgi:2-octaprenyl-6-methoxyphenol hydroxylase